MSPAAAPRLTVILLMVSLVLACTPPTPPENHPMAKPGHAAPSESHASPARFTWRPDPDTATSLASGDHALGVGGDRDGRVYVPPGIHGPAPLLVMLHGAGGSAVTTMRRVLPLAKEHRFVVVAPESRAATWDAIRGGFGPDVRFIDRALRAVNDSVPIDPERVALAGFSDGASYALSLGRANGDVFNALIALSPGFFEDAPPLGRPPVFVIHGTLDRVLPIGVTSRRVVPRLRSQGYDVTYSEFEGGHDVLPQNLARTIEWWLALPSKP